MKIEFKRLDHIMLCFPVGKEEEAREFYGNVLGLEEITDTGYPLPNGAIWYQMGDIQLPNISERMLTLVLKELEKNHLVARLAYAEVPVRVEYELTEYARTLSPIWHAMEQWGDEHKRIFGDVAQFQNA